MKNKVLIFVIIIGYVFIPSRAQSQNTFPNIGNVGIGTTTPNQPLHIVSNNPSILLSGETPNITLTTAPYTLAYNPAFIGITNEKGKYLPSAFSGDLIVKGQTNRDIVFGTNFINGAAPIERMRIANNGFVGIGVTNPQSKLHVDGVITTPSFKTNSKGVVKVRHFSAGEIQYNRALFPIYNPTLNRSKLVINHNGDFEDGVTIAGHQLNVNGKLAIGTTDTRGYKLAVNGNILTEELKIRTYTNWPDYVFEENYNLKPLIILESEIKSLGHLPNIPSAKKVKEEGFNIGEMNAKLLEKVEELTLYTIDQQKEIEQLKSLVYKLLKDN